MKGKEEQSSGEEERCLSSCYWRMKAKGKNEIDWATGSSLEVSVRDKKAESGDRKEKEQWMDRKRKLERSTYVFEDVMESNKAMLL